MRHIKLKKRNVRTSNDLKVEGVSDARAVEEGRDRISKWMGEN